LSTFTKKEGWCNLQKRKERGRVRKWGQETEEMGNPQTPDSGKSSFLILPPNTPKISEYRLKGHIVGTVHTTEYI
jgi:hypothetical protein